MAREITMTCKVGAFIFDKGIILSRAKLIRDAVMGQILNPKSRVELRTDVDVYNYVRDALSNDLARIPFEVRLAPSVTRW